MIYLWSPRIINIHSQAKITKWLDYVDSQAPKFLSKQNLYFAYYKKINISGRM